MKSTPLCAFALSLVALVGPASAAAPPTLVNYQGVLRDAAGIPESGSRDMIFRFFDASSGGNEILIDGHVVNESGPVAVTNGLFDVQLGSGILLDGAGSGTYLTLGEVFRDYQNVWMQIEVGGETLSPRVRVVSAPYCLNADRIDGKDGAELLDTSAAAQTKLGNLTVSGAVTAQSLTTTTGDLRIGTTNAPAQAAIFGVDRIVGPDDLRFYTDGLGITERMHLGATGGLCLGCSGDPGPGNFLLAGALNTGQGYNELYAMNQAVQTTSSVTFASVNTGPLSASTVDTGSGGYELYPMNQSVLTTANVQFFSLTGENVQTKYVTANHYLSAGGYYTTTSLRFAEDVVPTILAYDATMTFCVDANNNEGGQYFNWKINTFDGGPSTDMMMQLSGAGNLYVKGSVNPNTVFDLAELYRQAAPVEPGDLVRVVPGEPSAVAPTSGAYDKALIGVVSTKAGFLLGNAMDAESLRAGWGQKAFDTYQSLLPELRRAVLANEPSLQDDEARFTSPESFRAWFETEQEKKARTGASAESRSADDSAPEAEARETVTTKLDDADMAKQYDQVRASYESRMESMTLERFMAAKFAPIALAGRVPVKVDASFGAIEIGDSLTSSPISGVAMKATDGGPVIGMALEALASGRGMIEVFVGRSAGTTVSSGAATRPSSSTSATGTASLPEKSSRGSNALPAAPPDRLTFSTNGLSTAVSPAEPFPGTGSTATLEVARAVRAGELLVIGPNGSAALQPSFSPKDPMVVGVALADAVDGRAPVAGAGFAIVRVDASSQPIARGDLLVTSALAGHAMKAPSPAEPGVVIGKALEPLEFGTGKIRVLLMAR